MRELVVYCGVHDVPDITEVYVPCVHAGRCWAHQAVKPIKPCYAYVLKGEGVGIWYILPYAFGCRFVQLTGAPGITCSHLVEVGHKVGGCFLGSRYLTHYGIAHL